jgi:hypothetical protein
MANRLQSGFILAAGAPGETGRRNSVATDDSAVTTTSADQYVLFLSGDLTVNAEAAVYPVAVARQTVSRT